MSRYVMHDTWGRDNLRCSAMERKPRIKTMEPGQARHYYNAVPCHLCMPFKVARVIVLEQRP